MIERCLWADDAPVPERAAGAHAGAERRRRGGWGIHWTRGRARPRAGAARRSRCSSGTRWAGGPVGETADSFCLDISPRSSTSPGSTGCEEARRLFHLSLEAIAYLENVIAEERIACDYSRCGTVTLAAKPSHLRPLADSARFSRDSFGYETHLLGPAELRGEIASPRYHGGLLDPGAGALHPGRYVRGLAAAAEARGRHARGGCGGSRGEARREALFSSRRRAERCGRAKSWWRPTAIPAPPFPSCAAVSCPLAVTSSRRHRSRRASPRRLIPRGRVLSDTKNLLYYFRLSPDRRMVFGGRAAFTPMPVARAADLLGRAMVEVFPELGEQRSRTPGEGRWRSRWTRCRTRDVSQGCTTHWATPGHGVAMSTWLGARMGEALAGVGADAESHDPVPRRTAATMAGPGFCRLVGGYYRVKDLF